MGKVVSRFKKGPSSVTFNGLIDSIFRPELTSYAVAFYQAMRKKKKAYVVLSFRNKYNFEINTYASSVYVSLDLERFRAPGVLICNDHRCYPLETQQVADSYIFVSGGRYQANPTSTITAFRTYRTKTPPYPLANYEDTDNLFDEVNAYFTAVAGATIEYPYSQFLTGAAVFNSNDEFKQNILNVLYDGMQGTSSVSAFNQRDYANSFFYKSSFICNTGSFKGFYQYDSSLTQKTSWNEVGYLDINFDDLFFELNNHGIWNPPTYPAKRWAFSGGTESALVGNLLHQTKFSPDYLTMYWDEVTDLATNPISSRTLDSQFFSIEVPPDYDGSATLNVFLNFPGIGSTEFVVGVYTDEGSNELSFRKANSFVALIPVIDNTDYANGGLLWKAGDTISVEIESCYYYKESDGKIVVTKPLSYSVAPFPVGPTFPNDPGTWSGVINGNLYTGYGGRAGVCYRLTINGWGLDTVPAGVYATSDFGSVSLKRWASAITSSTGAVTTEYGTQDAAGFFDPVVVTGWLSPTKTIQLRGTPTIFNQIVNYDETYSLDGSAATVSISIDGETIYTWNGTVPLFEDTPLTFYMTNQVLPGGQFSAGLIDEFELAPDIFKLIPCYGYTNVDSLVDEYLTSALTNAPNDSSQTDTTFPLFQINVPAPIQIERGAAGGPLINDFIKNTIYLIDSNFEKLGTCVLKHKVDATFPLNGVPFINAIDSWFATRADTVSICLDKNDWKWVLAVADGTEAEFEPALDELGEYVYKLTQAEIDQLNASKQARLDVENYINAGELVIVSNDFMTYEMLYFWMRQQMLGEFNYKGAQLLSYIMINTDGEE